MHDFPDGGVVELVWFLVMLQLFSVALSYVSDLEGKYEQQMKKIEAFWIAENS